MECYCWYMTEVCICHMMGYYVGRDCKPTWGVQLVLFLNCAHDHKGGTKSVLWYTLTWVCIAEQYHFLKVVGTEKVMKLLGVCEMSIFLKLTPQKIYSSCTQAMTQFWFHWRAGVFYTWMLLPCLRWKWILLSWNSWNTMKWDHFYERRDDHLHLEERPYFPKI